MDGGSVIIFLLWLLGAGLIAFIAKKRRRSAIAWGLTSIVISPLLAYATLVAIPLGDD